MKAMEFFASNVPEPDDYSSYLPDFENAYICASLAQLSRKEAVGAQHTDPLYEEAVRSTLTGWGVDKPGETVFINSRRMVDSAGNPKRPGTQGLIVFHGDTAFVVFRSTEGKINDWFTDLNCALVDYPYGPGKVHKGFLEAFSAVVPDRGESPSEEFERVIGKLRQAKAVWLVGHSLGGALASIAAASLLQQEINVSGLYTFGTPRVGNDNYRDHMNAKLGHRYWRFMHKADVVPDLPFHITRLLIGLPGVISGYSREGCALRLNDSGYDVMRLIGSGPKWGRQVLGRYHGKTAADHSIDHYRARLLTLCQVDTPEFPEMCYVATRGAGKGTTQEDIDAIENELGG